MSPVWMEKTTLTRLTQRNAVRETPGYPEVEAALEQAEPKARLKDLNAVAAKYGGQPVHFLTLQARMSEHIKQKSDPAAIREAVGSTASGAGHGTEFLAGANLDIARNLMDHRPDVAGRPGVRPEVVKALQADHHPACASRPT